jgi:hypothetical protein
VHYYRLSIHCDSPDQFLHFASRAGHLEWCSHGY